MPNSSLALADTPAIDIPPSPSELPNGTMLSFSPEISAADPNPDGDKTPEYVVPARPAKSSLSALVRKKLTEGTRLRVQSRRQLQLIYKVLNRDKALPRCVTKRVAISEWLIEARKKGVKAFQDVERDLRNPLFKYGRWKALAGKLAAGETISLTTSDEVRRLTDAFRRYYPDNRGMVLAKRTRRSIAVWLE